MKKLLIATFSLVITQPACRAQSPTVTAAFNDKLSVPAASIVGIVPPSKLGSGTAASGSYLDGTGFWLPIPGVTVGTTPGLDILGQGTGTPTLPANTPTYYSGFMAPTSGTPAYLVQLPSTNPSAGFATLSAPTATTFNLAGGGTTTVNVSQLGSAALAGDPAFLAYTNATNAFTPPSGCSSGATTYWSMNGLQGRCNGNIYHNNYEEHLGLEVFKAGALFYHVTGNTSAPAIAAGAGAASCTIAGTDLDFTVTATMSGTPAAGTLCTVTFNVAYTGTIPKVTWGARNAISAAALTSVYQTSTLTAMTLTTAAALTASGSYSWDFHTVN